MDDNQAPENQDTPQDRIYGGKFKTPEELEAAYQESVRSQSHLSEENDRLSRYITLMDQPRRGESQESYVPTQNGDEEEVPAHVKTYVEKAISEKTRRLQEANDLESKFFADYPDLADERDLVLFHATTYRRELGGRYVSPDMVAGEVAKRTRAHLERIRKGTRSVPHVEGGSKGTAPAKRQEQDESADENQRLRAYMVESRAKKLKQVQRG